MTPERWKRVRQLFDAAVERGPGAAGEFLARQCAGDPEMYDEVRHMLVEHERTGILDHAPAGLSSAVASQPTATGTQPVFSAGELVAGRHRIVRYLSRGGMGEVYEAEDTELKERVALKTLLPAIASDESMVARFKQEIQLARRIGHPNVCRVFDLSRHPANGSATSPTLFLTMELLRGETLAAKLEREGRMSTADALPLLQQMAEALEAAHHSGVLHRDFKPSNVMLVTEAETVRAVVTDFGLARGLVTPSQSTVTISNNLLGTLDYMAPELLSGSAASFSSDVYALGMVAHKMVTGTLPFDSETPLGGAILRSKKAIPSPRTLVPDLSPNWERAILRALDPDPAHRFTNARHFVQSIEGKASSVTVKLPLITRRRLIGAGIAVVVLIGGFVGWRTWIAARDRPSAEVLALYQKGVDDIHAGAYFAGTKALSEVVRLAPNFSLGHARLAEAFVERDLAESAGQEMLVARRQDLSRLSQFDRLQIEAVDFRVTREFSAAAAKYEQMLALVPQPSADLYVDAARSYEWTQNRDKAIQYYRRAAEGPAHSASASLRLAVIYSRASDTANSENAFREAEKLYQFTSNLEGLTEVTLQRGVSANRRGKYDEGAAYLRNAIQTARLAGNIQQETNAELQLAMSSYASGDAALAEQYAREALNTAQQNQLKDLMVIGLIGLGNAHMLKRDFTGAEKFYLDALAAARREGLTSLVARCNFSLASLHNVLKRNVDAAHEAQEALNYLQPNHWVQNTFDMLAVLGRSQRSQSDYAAAMATFQRLLDTAEKAHNGGQTAVAYEGLGSVLREQEQFPQALEQYRNDVGASPEGPIGGYARLWCGFLLGQLGHDSDARAMWDLADRLGEKFPTLRLAVQEHRANLALIQGDYAKTIEIANRALAGDTQQDARSSAAFRRLLGLARLGSGKRNEGLNDCEQALTMASALGDPATLLQARMAAIQARIETGNLEGARSLFQEVELVLKAHPESRWRVLAMLARADRHYAPVARQALADLEPQWGKDNFQGYLHRPDIQKLVRPVLDPSLAK